MPVDSLKIWLFIVSQIEGLLGVRYLFDSIDVPTLLILPHHVFFS